MNTEEQDSVVGAATRYVLHGSGIEYSRSRLPCGIRRRSAVVRIAGSNPAGGMDICVVCSKYRQKAKCRTIKTDNQVRMKYRQYKRIQKKRSAKCMDVCIVCCIGKSDMRTDDIKVLKR